MKLKFTKMQGVGNDFVVLDGIGQQVALTPERARHIADRHFGVGCDQILLVERPQGAGADFRYRIWNADGGEVEQCGNGARCFARFVRDRGLTAKDQIRVETKGGLITPRLEPNGAVTVDMGAPVFAPKRIPFASDSAAVVTGIRRDLLEPAVAVDTRGGRLTIRWNGAENDLNCAVWLTGPAVTVFEGEIQID